jgi:hypothetical protein
MSWANNSGYGITSDGHRNMLTNKNDGAFTITELEVWEIRGNILLSLFNSAFANLG